MQVDTQIYVVLQIHMYIQIDTHIKIYRLNKVNVLIFITAVKYYHKVSGQQFKKTQFIIIQPWRSQVLKSIQNCLPSRDSKRESVSSPFLASNGCLYSLAHGSIFYFQRYQISIFTSLTPTSCFPLIKTYVITLSPPG